MTLFSRFFERALALPPAQTRDIEVQRDLRITMPDGVTLLADRYVARTADKPPLVLARSPYGRRGPWGMLAGRLFAERGFQAIVQSCRGTFGSGGELDPFGLTEQQDGLATVEWLRRQPWYPGTFGTFGPSYLGIVQWALAVSALPDHAAMAIQVTASEPRVMVRSGGSFALETMLEWIDQVARQEQPGAMARQRLRAGKLRELAGQLPLGQLDRLATGATKPYWQHWLADDKDYWESHGFAAGPIRVTAKVSMIGGWYDIFLPAQLRDYAALRAAGHEPRLTIGPWRHGDNDAAGVWVRDGLEFLTSQLTPGQAAPSGSPVRIFVTGASEWRDLPAWPPATDAQAWYLQANGGLAAALPGESGPDSYTYNPASPTPNLAGPVGLSGAARADNRELESRPDVVTYTSAALLYDLEVIGVPEVSLHVRSDNPHTDLFARLCEVTPAGVSVNVCDALLRLAHGEVEPATDGSVQVRFELWPVAHRFGAGNRLRLQISSGAHPRYARNLGTAEPLATAKTLTRAHQQVFHDPAHPSAVLLPVCP
jgi:putative CocE/NonD family hydrolase